MAGVERRLRQQTKRTEKLEVEAEKLAFQLRTAERELGDARAAYLSARESQKAAVERARAAGDTPEKHDDKRAEASFNRAVELERRNRDLAQKREQAVTDLLARVDAKEREVEVARAATTSLEKEYKAEVAAERAKKGRVPSRKAVAGRRLLSGARRAVTGAGRAVAKTAEVADKALETRQKAKAERERLAKAKLKPVRRKRRKAVTRAKPRIIRKRTGFGRRKRGGFKRRSSSRQ